MIWGQTVLISTSPNTEPDDVIISIKQIAGIRRWKKHENEVALQKRFEKLYPFCTVFLYNSGRSALYELLNAFAVGRGDEVIVQAFTCVAAIEPIIWRGAVPVYADIDPVSYSTTSQTIAAKITKRTKAILVQHTFGIPSDIKNITKLAKSKNILVIEDCAHSLGGTFENRYLGSFGDASFFSFGRDKIVSSVFGGVAIIKKSHIKPIAVIRKSYQKVPYPSVVWILQQLFHPIIMHHASKLYSYLYFGKSLIAFTRFLKIISLPYEVCELSAVKPSQYPKKYPDALAALALVQLFKLKRFNSHRIDCSRIYGPVIEGAVYLRYPILVHNPENLLVILRKKKIFIGTWYAHNIDPKGVSLIKLGYKIGSCPVAENISRHCINLPTHPRLKISQAKYIYNLVSAYQWQLRVN